MLIYLYIWDSSKVYKEASFYFLTTAEIVWLKICESYDAKKFCIFFFSMNCAFCIPSYTIKFDRRKKYEQMAACKKSIRLFIKQNALSFINRYGKMWKLKYYIFIRILNIYIILKSLIGSFKTTH